MQNISLFFRQLIVKQIKIRILGCVSLSSTYSSLKESLDFVKVKLSFWPERFLSLVFPSLHTLLCQSRPLIIESKTLHLNNQ